MVLPTLSVGAAKFGVQLVGTALSRQIFVLESARLNIAWPRCHKTTAAFGTAALLARKGEFKVHLGLHVA